MRSFDAVGRDSGRVMFNGLNEKQQKIIQAFIDKNFYQVDYPGGQQEWWHITFEILTRFACELVESVNETSG